MELYNDNKYIARLPHKCHICGMNILPAAPYHRESGIYEGDFFDRCTCLSCYMARQEYVDTNTDEEDYETWCISDHASETFCNSHYQTNPCADCNNPNPLRCPRVREHYEALYEKEYGQAAQTK